MFPCSVKIGPSGEESRLEVRLGNTSMDSSIFFDGKLVGHCSRVCIDADAHRTLNKKEVCFTLTDNYEPPADVISYLERSGVNVVLTDYRTPTLQRTLKHAEHRAEPEDGSLPSSEG